jgi:nucleotide-binding universal stress UspA family protein
MFKRLLVPIDDSEVSLRAMQASIELARCLEAGIVGFIAEPFAAGDRAAARHAGRVMSRFARLSREAGVPFTSHGTQASHVDEAILEAAQAHGCDMIVMATHDRPWLSRQLHPSCTRRVAARSPLPLLVLHG